uniref:HMA domain-containing protein n=1 Tax=Ananas comosus var. bracteatus TaxID=296719 RepID=A0A6V7PY57_ANACO|nr:unnamed protein product [Ananas comosus var. bracteatus]
MGVMEGVIDYLSELCEGPISRIKKRRKPKQLQTVAMKVRIDCEGCQRKIKNALKAMKGVTSVEVNAKQNKVTVTGYVEARKVMERLAQRTGKKVEPWPYVPYEMVPHPYAPASTTRRPRRLRPRLQRTTKSISIFVTWTQAKQDEHKENKKKDAKALLFIQQGTGALITLLAIIAISLALEILPHVLYCCLKLSLHSWNGTIYLLEGRSHKDIRLTS